MLFDFYIDKTYNDNIVHDIAETGENPVQVRYCTARYAGFEPGKNICGNRMSYPYQVL